MSGPVITRMKILALACLGPLVAAGSAHAQQGWPILGSNWDNSAGSRSSYSSSYSGGYSPFYDAPSNAEPSYYAAYPTSFRSYYPSYNAAISSGRDCSTSDAEDAGKRAARINLHLPTDAKIWFKGHQTRQTGTARSFESPPLDVGFEFTYQIRVEWKENGKEVAQAGQVVVHAGDVINLTLGSSPAVETAQ